MENNKEKISNYEEIKNIKQFRACISICSMVSKSAKLVTKDDKNILFIFDGVLITMCELPELKGKYNTYINVEILKKLLKNLDDEDILKLQIDDEKIIANINKKKYKKEYKFPNFESNTKEQDNKILKKGINLNPKNSIQTSVEWIQEQIDSLIFKDESKSYEKIVFNLKEKIFNISDDNKTSGESTISLFSFDEYKIDFTSKAKVKINWSLLKKQFPILKQNSEKILIKLDNEYPVKFVSYENRYKITMIIAPMIEND
jgi:hypothetical protein